MNPSVVLHKYQVLSVVFEHRVVEDFEVGFDTVAMLLGREHVFSANTYTCIARDCN